MIIRMNRKLICAVLSGMLALGMACGKKKSSSDSSDDNNDSENPEDVNSLALAVPSEFALSVFDSESGSSLRLGEVEDPNEGKPVQERIEEGKDILKGMADNCIDLDLLKEAKELAAITCYEFDSDMNMVTQNTGPNNTNVSYGTKDGTDGKGEACLVAFARNEAQTAVRLVDKAMGVIKGMICQAKKDNDEVEIPAAGEELDLVEAMEGATGGKLTVTEATIEAAEGTALVGDDVTVYTSKVTIEDFDGNEMTISLRNQTLDGVDSGVLSFSRPGNAIKPKGAGTDPNNSVNMNENLSVTYEIDREEKTAKILLLRAAMLKTIESFDDDGIVNVAEIPEASANDTSNRFNYLAFDMNTETGAGDLAYWRNPGGSYGEAARGFVFNVEENKDGALAGCGISGSAGFVANGGTSIRKAVKEGLTIEATGWWHPFFANNTNVEKDTANYGSGNGTKVTKQCFERNDDGVYEVTTDTSRGYEMVTVAGSGISQPKAGGIAPPPPPAAVK